MNLVYRHPSGGCLYQGNFKDATDVRALDAAGIKAVVFAAMERNYVHLPDRFDVIRARLDDNSRPSDHEKRWIVDCADKVSDYLVRYLARGQSAMTSCNMGLNRSGIMSGFTLVKLGIPAGQAIRMIRRARGTFALCNRAFVNLILYQDSLSSRRAV